MMKKYQVSIVMALLAAVLLGGCATSEERAAQKAEQVKKVTAALNRRQYKIAIARMYPMNGPSKTVTYGYSVEVKNDSLFSYLPYFGRAYNVPYGGGKGLNFSAPIGSYQEEVAKNGKRRIEIGLTNEEDTYLYILEVFDNGSSTVSVMSRQREQISYSGDMEFDR
jgi:hypothetical protein